MTRHHLMTRRESIKKLLQLTGGAACTGIMTWAGSKPLTAWAEAKKPKFIVEGYGSAEGILYRH